MKSGLLFGILLAVFVDLIFTHGDYTSAFMHFVIAIPQDIRGWGKDLWGI